MKQNINTNLIVRLLGMTAYWDKVDHIDIAFVQYKNGPVLKLAKYWNPTLHADEEIDVWRGTGNDADLLYVPFSREDTLKFREGAKFFMDIRPTLTTGYDLVVKPVSIRMDWSAHGKNCDCKRWKPYASLDKNDADADADADEPVIIEARAEGQLVVSGWDTSRSTVTPDKMLEGVTAVDANGRTITGTIPTVTYPRPTLILQNSGVTIRYGGLVQDSLIKGKEVQTYFTDAKFNRLLIGNAAFVDNEAVKNGDVWMDPSTGQPKRRVSGSWVDTTWDKAFASGYAYIADNSARHPIGEREIAVMWAGHRRTELEGLYIMFSGKESVLAGLNAFIDHLTGANAQAYIDAVESAGAQLVNPMVFDVKITDDSDQPVYLGDTVKASFRWVGHTLADRAYFFEDPAVKAFEVMPSDTQDGTVYFATGRFGVFVIDVLE